MQRSDVTPKIFKQVDAPLKVYVAGIDLKNMDLDIQSQTKCIINLIDEIKKDAVASLGKDATVIAVLHECALTRCAISNNEKKLCVATLENAIKKLDNVLLIPGSFA